MGRVMSERKLKKLAKVLALMVLALGCGCSDSDRDDSLYCLKQCDGRTCGTDGCGGTCGTCGFGTVCISGTCQSTSCAPNCPPECDPKCTGEEICKAGRCIDPGECDPKCGEGYECIDGECSEICVPYCTDRECGSDGCGGTCGECDSRFTCNDATGQCMDWRVTGKLTIEKRNVKYSNYQLPVLDKSEFVVVPGIDVSLYDYEGQLLGTAKTAADGTFDIAAPRLPLSSDWLSVVPVYRVNDKLQFAVLVGNVNNNANYDLWQWTIKLSNYTAPDAPGDMGEIRITERQHSGALYLYNLASKAFETLIASGFEDDYTNLPSIGIVWKPGIVWECGSCYINAQPSVVGDTILETTMLIGGASKDESAWGYPTFFHEFGHYVLARRKDTTSGGDHNISTACKPTLAWSEGFATFFSQMIQSLIAGEPRPVYWRVLSSGSFWTDYSRLFDDSSSGSHQVPQPSLTDEQGMKQNLGEVWVTYMLWNLWDGDDIPDLSTPPDDIALGTSGIYKTLSSVRYLFYGDFNTGARNAYGVDFVDFIDALLCDSTQTMFEKITKRLKDNQFPYDNNPACPQ